MKFSLLGPFFMYLKNMNLDAEGAFRPRRKRNATTIFSETRNRGTTEEFLQLCARSPRQANR